ncbi:hypothetical protein chiPu_0000705 [Chiloscyllium punctatum]|uniref:Uncharacterized protein n=1 Tax=Chiloscyllium punctatum TaxID=137246 RepID=A0A401RVY6_CHIPU|nr:hypothetical protein [Chiloscyllium punctatum]
MNEGAQIAAAATVQGPVRAAAAAAAAAGAGKQFASLSLSLSLFSTDPETKGVLRNLQIMAVKTPAQGTGVLLTTANVGSLFEDGSISPALPRRFTQKLSCPSA